MNVTTANNTNLKGENRLEKVNCFTFLDSEPKAICFSIAGGIAAGSYDKNNNFIDNGNLDLTTKTLTFSNSTDSVYTSGNSFSLGTNIGFSKDVKDPQPKDDSTIKINSTNLAFSNSMGYQRNKTLATLGQGNVTITDTQNSDDITSLNRDTQNISKTMINTSYGVNVDATLDHRLLTEDGREEIKQEYEDMGKNMAIVGKTLPDAESDNPIESTIGTIWDWIAHGTLDILPSNENNGGVLRNVPILFGEEDSLFTINGEGNKLYINGILNFLPKDARIGGRNLIGDDKFQNAFNPSSGILGDLIEAGIDVLPLWQTGISKQIDKVQNQENWTDIYLHSQAHLISQYNPNPNVNYYSYGAPMFNSKIKKIFNIQEDSDIQKNNGDPVAKPWIIFTPWKFITEDGHGTENYGVSKQAQ